MAEHRTRKPSEEKKTHGSVIKSGDRMKETFVRSKQTAKNLTKDGYDNAENYAVDNTTEAGRELAHDAASTATRSAKKAVDRGRTAAKKAQAKKRQDKEASETAEPGAEGRPLELLDEAKTKETNKPPQVSPKKKEELAKKHRGKERDQAALSGLPNRETDLQSQIKAQSESIFRKKADAGKLNSAEPRLSSNPVTAPERQQSPMYPSSPKRRMLPTESGDAKAANRGIINGTGTGRNSRFPSSSARAAGQAQQAVRQEQSRQAYVAAKNKAIASARTQRSIRKRIAAAVEQTRKAAESIGAVAGGAGFAIVILLVSLFLVGAVATSGFGIFFSPDANKQSPQKLPDVVRELNTEFQNKIENIKATVPHDTVEMYGARAVWPEVLSIYAVKTTTDPENGMEVATMNDAKKRILTDIFWEMNEISYTTHTESYTVKVPVADKDGNVTEKEVIEYYTTLIITVSHLTAEEAAAEYRFNQIQNEELKELVAMDNSMWLAVLYGLVDGAYGEYGEIVQVALSQVGNIGGQPYWSWYGFNSRVEWCACFVSWCADKCGYIDAGLIPQYAWCPYGVQWFQERNQWIDGSMEPAPGMIIFYDWNKESTNGQDGVSDHTGIVEYVENGIVHTVEGNWGDSVAQRELPVGYYEILGYGFISDSSNN